MERHGYIHEMLEVKVLILSVLNRVQYPVNAQTIYELCYQDELLTYFDVQEALPQLLSSEHIERDEEERYQITEKGRQACAVTEDSVAFSVISRAQAAAERYNKMIQRSKLVHAEVQPLEDGAFTVHCHLSDDMGQLLHLELMAPSLKQGRIMAAAFEKRAEKIYQLLVDSLLE